MQEPALAQSFAALRRGDPESDRALAEAVDKVNRKGGSYHRLDFGDGIVLEGDYDMRRYVGHYRLPEDLSGQHVLDVGTASGYLALECARRGGLVTAIDPRTTFLAYLASMLNVHGRFVQKDVYTLDASFGQFDLVVCGSVLLHLPEQFEALRRMRSVCRHRLVVSTCAMSDSATSSRPLCEFLGLKTPGEEYWTYWSLSARALERMLLTAGFARVENVEHFLLASEPGRGDFATPHVVMSAYV